MSCGTAIEGLDRKDAQAALVKRIADIATRAVPGDEGVHLRFINNDAVCNNLSAAQVEAKLQFSPGGGTALGANLTKKVLQPLVYDVIEKGEPLARPLLVLTITDGCPNSGDDFLGAIKECNRRLGEKGYKKTGLFTFFFFI